MEKRATKASTERGKKGTKERRALSYASREMQVV